MKKLIFSMMVLVVTIVNSHAYYNATAGKWLSRDPIGESGGINLYGFVCNDGINNTDWLGYTKKNLVFIVGAKKDGGYDASGQINADKAISTARKKILDLEKKFKKSKKLKSKYCFVKKLGIKSEKALMYINGKNGRKNEFVALIAHGGVLNAIGKRLAKFNSYTKKGIEAKSLNKLKEKFDEFYNLAWAMEIGAFDNVRGTGVQRFTDGDVNISNSMSAAQKTYILSCYSYYIFNSNMTNVSFVTYTYKNNYRNELQTAWNNLGGKLKLHVPYTTGDAKISGEGSKLSLSTDTVDNLIAEIETEYFKNGK